MFYGYATWMIFAHKQEFLNRPNYFVCINTKILSGNQKHETILIYFLHFHLLFLYLDGKMLKVWKMTFISKECVWSTCLLVEMHNSVLLYHLFFVITFFFVGLNWVHQHNDLLFWLGQLLKMTFSCTHNRIFSFMFPFVVLLILPKWKVPSLAQYIM